VIDSPRFAPPTYSQNAERIEREQFNATVLERLVRIETRLVKLMVYHGLDAEGAPRRRQAHEQG
jgi:hypothetical protein